jgi:uncharacterized protein
MMELAETADIAAQRPSTSDAKDRSSDELGRRLPTELFAIPTDFGTLLYAPLGRRLLMVNGVGAGRLARLAAGERCTGEAEVAFATRLADAGFLLPADSADTGVSFPAPATEFDPHGLTLFLTGRCSMRCVYCYSRGGESARVMPFDTAQAAIAWIVEHTARKGRNHLFLTVHGGGDPTMCLPLLRQVVSHARQMAFDRGLQIRVDAGLNGVMNKATADWVVANLDSATISLDGVPEVHNHQRPLRNGANSFSRVCRTLARFDETGFHYGLRMTVTNFGLHRLNDSIELMASAFSAPGGIQVEPMFGVGRAADLGLEPLDSGAFVAAFRSADAVARRYGRRLKYSGARFDVMTNAFCKATGESFAVTPEGLLTSCYEVADSDDPRSALFVFGRFDSEHRQFSFDADRLARLRSLTVEHKPQCADCFCKWHCAGDCPAKIAALGDPWDPSSSPRCHINRELTKDQIIEFLRAQPREASSPT